MLVEDVELASEGSLDCGGGFTTFNEGRSLPFASSSFNTFSYFM